MPKRKKHPRLPSGYGSIRYLGSGRRNPYAVHPPAERGQRRYEQPPALCYVPDWYTGFGVLTAWHAGTYTPGLEHSIRDELNHTGGDIDAFCERIIRDHNLAMNIPQEEPKISFRDAWALYEEWKFGENAPKKLSQTSRNSVSAVFKAFAELHDRPLESITLRELQTIINDNPRGKSTKNNLVVFAKQFYSFATVNKLCQENAAEHLYLPSAKENEHGVPFSEEDLKTLAKDADHPIAEMLLIMSYSGFRISEYLTMEVNMTEGYFKGGIKTEAGKGRIVPIHSGIRPLVASRLRRDGAMLTCGVNHFREKMYAYLEAVGIEKHTPHDCRHTFSMLSERYGVREADRKRMLGHSLSNDMTNGIYGHRSIEDLRREIEKIPFVVFCDK